jgi:PAS domain S-box-containing protein
VRDPATSGPAIAKLLRTRKEEILKRWEAAVRQLPRARNLPAPELRDDVPDLLDRIALVAEAGLEPGTSASHEEERLHALVRLQQGFDAAQVVAELALLRRVVLQVWSEDCPLEVGAVLAMGKAIDDATAASVEAFTHFAQESAEQREGALRDTEAELRRAVQQREQSSALFEGIFQNAPVGIGFWDRELRYERVNERLAEINGLPPEAHVGKTPSELLPGIEEIRDLEARWREMLRTGRPDQPRDLAGETPAAPGARRWFREHAYPVRSGDEVLGVGAVIVERTDEHRSENALALLARTSDALAAVAEPGVLLERIARMLVFELADWAVVVLRGQDGARRVAVAADPRRAPGAREILEALPVDAAAARGVGRVLREGVPELVSNVDDEFLARAAETPEVRARAAGLGLRSYLAVPLRVRDEITGAISLGLATSSRRFDGRDLALVREVARRCAVAIENARLFQEARREADLRQRVLAVVSHDLRNPLSAILMSASRIEGAAPEGVAGDRVRRGADTIRRSADRMNRLINDLLDVAVIESGSLSIVRAPQQPDALVREVAEAFHGTATEKGLALEVEAPAGLPMVLGDHDRLVQVLSNLVGNAVKATDAGAIAVAVGARANEAVFTVRDTGPGIAPDVLPRLFDPYFRGRDAPYKGTGLGLWIAKGIVDAHGGVIRAESVPGQGATFQFTIPLA